MITELPEGARWLKNSKQTFRLHISSLLVRPQGATDQGETAEFNILGLECDHEALELLETKNLSKTSIFKEFWLFSSVFGF